MVADILCITKRKKKKKKKSRGKHWIISKTLKQN